jgi:hypothetical protein
MSSIVFDLQNLYQRQFGSKPVVPKDDFAIAKQEPYKINGSNSNNISTTGSNLIEKYRGIDIWLPVNLYGLDPTVFGASKILMPYVTIRISGKKHFIKTPMAERQGTVKEQYSIEDYDIDIKGFLIGYDSTGRYPIWPDKEIKILSKLWKLNEAIELDNAITNEFVDSDQKVVIEDFDLPPVEGGRTHIKPFTLKIASDSIFDLEFK